MTARRRFRCPRCDGNLQLQDYPDGGLEITCLLCARPVASAPGSAGYVPVTALVTIDGTEPGE